MIKVRLFDKHSVDIQQDKKIVEYQTSVRPMIGDEIYYDSEAYHVKRVLVNLCTVDHQNLIVDSLDVLVDPIFI